MSMDRLMRHEARLILLQALAAQQPSETLNTNLLIPELQRYGISFTRPQVNGELDYLASLDAVTLIEAGEIKIATLNELGHRHLKRLTLLDGVKRPDRAGA